MQVYRALSDFRHRENGIAAANTAAITDIPAWRRHTNSDCRKD
jgi:hypothetical protein